jgi:hypothetical protein
MKTCYYEVLGVERDATSTELKKVLSSIRPTLKCRLNSIPTRTNLKMPKKSSRKLTRLTNVCPTPTNEPGMIITGTKFYPARMARTTKISSKPASEASTSKNTSTAKPMTPSMTKRKVFSLSTEISLKKLRAKNPKPSIKANLTSTFMPTQALVIAHVILIWSTSSMSSGITLQLIRIFHGPTSNYPFLIKI